MQSKYAKSDRKQIDWESEDPSLRILAQNPTTWVIRFPNRKINGILSSSETQNVRCQRCRAECSTLSLVVWCQSKHVCTYLVYIYACMCHKANLLSVMKGVKILSTSIFGMTGTDAMDTYLTGGGSTDQQRAALESPPLPPPPPPHHLSQPTSTTTSNTAQAQ